MSKKFCDKNIFKVNKKEILLELIKYQYCRHIETINTANQLTGFYMRATMALNGLNCNWESHIIRSVSILANTWITHLLF